MFNAPITVPDKISTLELSKIWLYKALQDLEQQLADGNALSQTDPEQDRSEEDQESSS